MTDRYKIHHVRGDHNATVVYDMLRGTFGVSVCAPGDNFDRKKGVSTAAKRAFVAWRKMGDCSSPVVGVPPMDGVVGRVVRRALFETYPLWQGNDAISLLMDSALVEIPYAALPRLLTIDQIERGEFLGYDYYELAEVWGVYEAPVEDALRNIMRDEMCQLCRGLAPGKVTSDLRKYVRALANKDDTCSTMLWCGLALTSDDETFLKYCDTLLEHMWR